MNIGSAISRLFSDNWERRTTDTSRQEPRLTSLSGVQNNTSDSKAAGPVVALPAPSATPQPRFDLRNVSPRQFADVTHELYMEGTLTWAEFQMVGFPSELDPRYDETIGALTGEKAQPDKPRDMLGQWEQRVEFEKRYNPSPEQVQVAENALEKLTWQIAPPVRLSA
ncbi:conserved hypothetical protein [Candidatus Terasakiella magnetica]|nr:conserved hypothetical protein [Candidatus Terasakiella magnetica]